MLSPYTLPSPPISLFSPWILPTQIQDSSNATPFPQNPLLRPISCRLLSVKSTCKIKSSQTEIVSDEDPLMLKSVESDEQQIRVFEMTESQSKITLPILLIYLFFIDDSDVTVEHVVPFFMALNYRTIIVELVGR